MLRHIDLQLKYLKHSTYTSPSSGNITNLLNTQKKLTENRKKWEGRRIC